MSGTASRTAVRSGWAVVGVALLSTSSIRWVSSGAGSSFDGLDLADVLRQNVFVPGVGDVVAAVIYSVVASGALVLVSIAADHRLVVVARGVLCAVGAAAFLLVGATGALPWTLWGAGAMLAAASYALGLVLTTVQVLTMRQAHR